jgi:hypothetical protein
MEYLKLVPAVLAVVLAGVLPAIPQFGGLADLGVTGIANVVVLGIGAFGVWAAANLPQARWIKTAVAGVAFLGTAVISAYSDAFISTPEWVQMAVGFLAAIGVGGLRNANTSDGVFVAGRHAVRQAA